MGGLFDYLDWRGELSLAQSPFNPVDNLLLSTLSYAPLDHLVDREGTALWAAAERWEAAGGVWPPRPERGREEFREEVLRLFGALARAPRFSGLMLLDWVSHLDAGTEEQVAALTIDTGDGARFVSYRGTDSTLVGWKEDFNMSYQTPVPAQRSAAEYLSDALRRWGGPLRLGGHSKGGNLAVYAAAACRLRSVSSPLLRCTFAHGFYREWLVRQCRNPDRKSTRLNSSHSSVSRMPSSA